MLNDSGKLINSNDSDHHSANMFLGRIRPQRPHEHDSSDETGIVV